MSISDFSYTSNSVNNSNYLNEIQVPNSNNSQQNNNIQKINNINFNYNVYSNNNIIPKMIYNKMNYSSSIDNYKNVPIEEINISTTSEKNINSNYNTPIIKYKKMNISPINTNNNNQGLTPKKFNNSPSSKKICNDEVHILTNDNNNMNLFPKNPYNQKQILKEINLSPPYNNNNIINNKNKMNVSPQNIFKPKNFLNKYNVSPISKKHINNNKMNFPQQNINQPPIKQNNPYLQSKNNINNNIYIPKYITHTNSPLKKINIFVPSNTSNNTPYKKMYPSPKNIDTQETPLNEIDSSPSGYNIINNNNQKMPKMQLNPEPKSNNNNIQKKKLSPTFLAYQQLSDSFKDGNILFLSRKSLSLNIIHYDENLRKTAENNNYCSFFKSEVDGTFYGINNFELFTYICHKIQQDNKQFILICSGSCAKKIFDYCSQINIEQIPIYYIFCMKSSNYQHLKSVYPKLKEIFTSFDLLKNVLFSLPKINYNPIKSSNLIFLSDYNKTYIKLHFEIVRKYSLYKLLKSNQNDKNKFLDLIKMQKPYYLNLAKELSCDDDEQMIKYFKENTKEPEENLRKVFNTEHNIQNFISNYTVEGFYYKYINKFLREGDFNSFRILSNHISKFIYHLYEYRKFNQQSNRNTLYRKLFISQEELTIYVRSIGKVICYPSFSSTSISQSAFNPINSDPNLIFVLLIIQQNNSKSIISIRDLSKLKYEEEYLCLPFSFFRIDNVLCTNNRSAIINLTALNSEKPIEEMFLEYMEKETDNLDPEGLDMLKLTNDNLTLVLNPKLKAENKNNSN